MAIRAILALATVATLVSGCYVDPGQQDRAPSTAGGETVPNSSQDTSGSSLTDQATCHYVIGRGCFDGHIAALQEFTVDGKQFFNADDLATRFSELLTVDSAGQPLAAGQGYKLTMLTPVDNQSFVTGFAYDLKGERPTSGQVRDNGNFSINDLPEGTYDLRVQKAVRFELSASAATSPAANAAGDDVPSPSSVSPKAAVAKTYCATLYADTTLDVRRGQRTWNSFSDFKLHVTDNVCAAGGNQTTLTLDP